MLDSRNPTRTQGIAIRGVVDQSVVTFGFFKDGEIRMVG
jgi:hypothetical protein